MTDPFPASEFDDWAESYDESVSTDQFPFFGYQDALKKTAELAGVLPGMSVLDLGTGTGSLAAFLAARRCEVWGTDFSKAMLAKARQKVPQAHFILHDFRHGWPAQLPPRFDRIVSAYVFHHFESEEKIRLVNNLMREHLAANGRLVIADITFPHQAALETLKGQVDSQWEAEHYWVAAEDLAAFEAAGLKAGYTQVSVCAGIFTFEAMAP